MTATKAASNRPFKKITNIMNHHKVYEGQAEDECHASKQISALKLFIKNALESHGGDNGAFT